MKDSNHFYSFGTNKREKVETYSKKLADMGIYYYIKIEPVTSHNTFYVFFVSCSDDELKIVEKLFNKKIKKED